MRGKHFRLNGCLLMVLGVLFGFVETIGYGGHGLPNSTPEAICDLISFLEVLLGFVLMTVGQELGSKR